MTSIQRLGAVLARTGHGRSTVYAQIKEGIFPPPVALGARSVGWPESEISEIIGARIAGFSAEQVRDLVKSLVAQRANRNPMHEYQ